jgi:hypothetical protein
MKGEAEDAWARDAFWAAREKCAAAAAAAAGVRAAAAAAAIAYVAPSQMW